MTCRTEVREGVALLTLDNPPVNALTPEVLDSLFAQLRRAQANADVRAIVLTGAGGAFSAGFDFKLFGSPAMESVLAKRQDAVRELAALLEGGAKPTVAAVAGACLGGGCELAMACNARVCAEGASLGLPETRLGVIPGLGGTQRLPRLVGMERALDMMLTGKPLSAEAARAAGLADAVVSPEQLLDAATQLALELASGATPRRKTLQLAQHMQKEGEGFAAAAAAVLEAHGRAAKQYPGQPQYSLLLEAVAAGLAHGTPAGLQKEGEGFRAACASRNHKLTLALFLAHQQLKHKPGLAWLLAQAWLLLGLLCLFLFRRLSYLCSSFATGYNRARRRGGAADSGRADSGSGRADSGGTRGGGSSGRRKK